MRLSSFVTVWLEVQDQAGHGGVGRQLRHRPAVRRADAHPGSTYFARVVRPRREAGQLPRERLLQDLPLGRASAAAPWPGGRRRRCARRAWRRPPSSCARPARAPPRRRWTSFIRSSACSGVLVTSGARRSSRGSRRRSSPSSAAAPCASRRCRGCGGRGPRRVPGRSPRTSSARATSPAGWYGFTDGPPILSTSRPATASAWSRTISAGSRKRGPRASSRFSGSRCSSSGVTRRRLPVGGAHHDQSSAAP